MHGGAINQDNPEVRQRCCTYLQIGRMPCWSRLLVCILAYYRHPCCILLHLVAQITKLNQLKLPNCIYLHTQVGATCDTYWCRVLELSYQVPAWCTNAEKLGTKKMYFQSCNVLYYSVPSFPEHHFLSLTVALWTGTQGKGGSVDWEPGDNRSFPSTFADPKTATAFADKSW